MNLLLIGFGAIARCFCTLKDLPVNKIFIIDKKPYKNLIEKFFLETNYSYKFIKLLINQKNIIFIKKLILKENIKIVIDCSYNISTFDLLKILPPKVGYLNTSIEDFPQNSISIIESLKKRQDEIKNWYNKNKPQNPILLDCGMNPGMISLWAIDGAKKFNIDPKKVEKVIISEYDSQIRKSKTFDKYTFYGTWSVQGLLEEIHSPIEGNSQGKYFVDEDTTGFKTTSYSLKPNNLEPFLGATVRHSENITMKNYFPNCTSMFIYKCCDDSVTSLNKYYNENKPIKKEHIMYSPEIKEGVDQVGVWIIGDRKVFWYGSELSNDIVKNYNMSKYINSTTYQVCKGLFVGLMTLIYCLENDIYKLMWPEDISKFPFFDDLLNYVNRDLNIKIYDYSKSKNEDLKLFVDMKTFQDHQI